MPKDDIDFSAMRQPVSKMPAVTPVVNQRMAPDEFVPARAQSAIAPQIMPEGMPQQGAMQYTQKVLPGQAASELASASNYLTKAQLLQKDAIEKQETSALEIARIQAEQAASITQENERLLTEYNEKQQAYNTAVNEADRTIAQTQGDYAAAKIDPQRIFKADNNNRVLAGISLALGAMGSALSGQRNYALDIINSVIDRDIEEQKYEASKKYTQYENAKKERDILDSRFSNDVDKLMVQKNMRLDAVKAKIEGMIATAKTPEIKARTQELLAQLNEQIAQNKITIFQNYLAAAPTMTTQIGGMSASQTAAQEKGQKEVKEFTNFKKQMLDAFNEAGKYGVVKASLPSAFGGEKSSYEGLRALLAGAIIGKVPGIKSDSDFENIIVPLLPKASDTKDAIDRNYKVFERFLNSAAPASYLETQEKQKPVYQPKTFQK